MKGSYFHSGMIEVKKHKKCSARTEHVKTFIMPDRRLSPINEIFEGAAISRLSHILKSFGKE